MSDRIGRRPVVLGGAALFALASFGLAMARDGETFLALRVLQALGASAALVGTFATVRDVFADTPHGTLIYGLFGSMLAFVPALGPVLGAAIATVSGWRAIFFMLGALAIPALVHAWARWPETRPRIEPGRQAAGLSRILGKRAFQVYTLGFGTAMGAFFVFFSIAPLVLIDRAGLSPVSFSLAFASVALVMIVSTRFVGPAVGLWGVAGCFVRGLVVIAAGALVLAGGAVFAQPHFVSFVMPMWLIAIGIVGVVSVSANGALRDFAEAAGSGVALYYGMQSLIVSGLGTLSILVLDGASAWPLVAYGLVMSAASLAGYAALART